MLEAYAALRTHLLGEIVTNNEADNRIIAVWLTGSLGRGKGDAISDLDLTVILNDESAEKLCKRPFQKGGQTTPERLALFSRFGHPAIIHENHNNAPPGGTFTCVIYDETALIVDWILVPQSLAVRPRESRLLFDKVGIPLQSSVEPLETAERATIAAEKTAFFWMMAFIIVKYIVREDTLLFNSWLDDLHWLVNDIEGLLSGKEIVFDPKKRPSLALTAEEQKEALCDVCQRMEAMGSTIVEMGGYLPNETMSAVEKRLALV
ncbi:MAG: nucleotidyltransferase domain-containing protein [Candidatus Promineifilaceae bacterium]